MMSKAGWAIPAAPVRVVRSVASRFRAASGPGTARSSAT